ncbi:MAG: DUF1566 domain-containing protein [Thermodesulfobacteriota bacterium]
MGAAWAFIPWTGQTGCFDASGMNTACAGSGQDGESRPGVPWPEPRFTVAERVALDALTGLSWPVDASAGSWPMTWAEAAAWIESANRDGLLGWHDWRLPSRRELLYLASPARARPALPPHHPFKNLFQHWHWTSTPAASAEGHAWRVHLEGGRMFPGPVEASHMVMPVRGAGRVPPVSPALTLGEGAPWPSPRFDVSGVEALDRLTGLVWLARVLPGSGGVTWEEALATARSMGGGWRLATIFELESLVDASTAWPALTPGHPFGKGLDGVWSSTSSGYDHAWAWVLYFGKGAVGVGHKPGRHFRFLLTKSL